MTGGFRKMAEAAERAARHRQWLWCRRPNGFSDMPKWRTVAELLGLPLFQVQAFVNRLEELANGADHRGSVEGFKANDFGTAHGMSAADAQRIFDALEHPDIGWISSGHIADFYPRNRDREDETAAVRKRRQRAREKILKSMAVIARQGLITPAQRDNVEARLLLLDDDALFALGAAIDRSLRTGTAFDPVTRDAGVSQRDSVTVTLEQSRIFKSSSVKDFGDNSAGNAAGLPKEDNGAKAAAQAAAESWLANDGIRIVVKHLEVDAKLAKTRMNRWRGELRSRYPDSDAPALVQVIIAAEAKGYIGARFLNLIISGIQRYQQEAAGPQLPFGPVLAKKQTGRSGR